MIPIVDEAKCTGCGSCIDICPSECFELQGEKSKVVRPEECVECEACVTECADEAITLKE